MKEIITSITRGGQLTLPAEVQKILGVKPGDKVALAIDNDEVRLVPARFTLESAAGSVQPATRTEDLKKLADDANEEMATREVAKLEG